MSQRHYFEDFEVGATDEYGQYAVTREEVIEFASRFDPQPFHLSEEAGQATHFGGLCASGWHTGAMAMRMIVDHMPAGGTGALGSPGLEELRWRKPVYPGDMLKMRSTVVDRRESRSRPELGLVVMENQVLNQHDEVVMSFRPTVMYRRRPA
ncbi:MAG: MaoC family dehydratase [Gammaproteobacteria bacterium]|nr:MaoC family dehydratase [Pseudomonadales bacterium]MCP5349345.1 MaoC family dehydratase [Pseudomonadales bacterium]